MNFVNNWRRQMELAQAAASVPLDLPDGDYALVMSDAPGASATRWEYLRAVVSAGVAELQRGQEGSGDQDWPDGSWISGSLTAGVMALVFDRLDAQAAQISALTDRVQLLEAMIPARVVVTVGGTSALVGCQAGFFGSVSPAQVIVPGEGGFTLHMATFDTPSEPFFQIQFRGEFPPERLVSVTVEGAGTLNVADGYSGNSDDGAGPITMYSWEGGFTTDWFSSIGQARAIEFTFAAD